ncbi:aminotransferase class IV, partial [Candidatus Micrarchaeota archaeon]|nr:aminotransferase class IV [Candidatus Micrarchaeota archaeon]
MSEVLGFKFREVLVRNSDGGFVEGSAENIALFFELNGQIVAKTPQAGDETGILAGTTRSRFLEWCENNGTQVIFGPITDADLRDGVGGKPIALVLMGTGVGAVHVRSVTRINNLREVMDAHNGLKPETDSRRELRIPSLLQDDYETILINDGKKHPIVDRLQRDINSVGSKLPLWQIDIAALAQALEISIESVVPKSEASRFRSGDLLTREDKRELDEKMRIAKSICGAAMRESHKRIISL